MKNSRSPLRLKRCWTINIPLLIGCLLVLLSMPGKGYATIAIDINSPSIQKIKIAIPDFKDLATLKGHPELAADLPAIISADLDFSGYFLPMDKSAFLARDGDALTIESIDFKNWTVIGAELLVTAGYTCIGSNNVEVEIRLYDTFFAKEILAKKFLGKLDATRTLMHRVSNEIVNAITGAKGPFLSKVVFVNNSTGTKEIYMCDYDGQNPVQLTSFKSISLFPRYSPLGDSIAFNSYKDGEPGLYIMDLSTRGVRKISGKETLLGGASWLPSGDKLAMTLKKNDNQDIFVISADGKIADRMTSFWGIDVSPTFSPDGKRMAFVSNRSGGPQIYIKDLSTGDEERITYDLDYCTSPVWSQTNKIAFSVMKDNKVDIYTINPDGSNLKRLTEENGNNEDPSWSPDGRYIIFSSNRDGGSHLYIMSSGGENQKRITFMKGQDTSPGWSPF